MIKLVWKFYYSHKIFKPEFKGELSQKMLLLNSVANIKKMRFVIYFSFFIFLFLFSMSNLNNINLFYSKDTNLSIFYAFITFLAFDRIMENTNLMKIDFKQLIYTLGKFNRPGVDEEEKYHRSKKRESIKIENNA